MANMCIRSKILSAPKVKEYTRRKKMLDAAIHRIIRTYPDKYNTDEYRDSSHAIFKVILDRMSELGVHTALISHYNRKEIRYNNRKGITCIRYVYSYQIVMNYITVKVYRAADSAKYYILKTYLKMTKHGTKDETV